MTNHHPFAEIVWVPTVSPESHLTNCTLHLKYLLLHHCLDYILVLKYFCIIAMLSMKICISGKSPKVEPHLILMLCMKG